MQLTLDLRFVPAGRASSEDERVVTLGDLRRLGPNPAELARLLWGQRYDGVIVLEDDLQRSAPQAGALALGGLARGGRPALLLRAIARLAVALPRELAGIRTVRRSLARVLLDGSALPRAVSDPQRVTYMRADATILWDGAYVGGAATHTTGVINGLRANGLEVEVFAPERPDGIRNVEFVRVPLRRAFHLVHWFTVANYGEEVVRAARSSRPDFVYQRYALGSYAGIELARELEVPLVLEYNGSEVWGDKHWGARGLQRVGDLEALELRNVRSASLVVVVSDVLRDQLVEQGVAPDRVLVNPNGVDTAALQPYRERAASEWRRVLNLADAPTVGFIGTFGLWHGVLELPETIERVAAERPDVRWLLIGGGRLHGEVRDQIEARGLADKVELVGVVAHERALELLSACDVCVSPHVPNPDGTPFFGSPTKLFEYMGLGKPIVASRLEQIGEVIVDGQTGLLHEPGDSAAAAAAVLRLVEDEKLRARLGAAALESARTTYSWEAHTRRILEALAG